MHSENALPSLTELDLAERLNQALACHRAGRLEEAETGYKTVLAEDPRHAGALRLLGILAGQAGQPDKAVEWIERAIRIQPGEPTFHNDLGNAYKACGKFREARASYETAIALVPGYADAWFNLGNAHRAERHFPAAIACYRRSIALSPLEADAHSNLGTALLELGQTAAAIAALERAIALNPAYAEAHFNLGTALAGDPVRAIPCFERAIALRPNYPKAWQNLGVAQEGVGNLLGAHTSYLKALELQPGDTKIASNLAAVMLLTGDETAIDILKDIVEKEPEQVTAHWNLAMALLLHGDYERGWREHEWRWKWDKFSSPNRGFPQPQWRGEALPNATVLLHAEQGWGDSLQFVRYVPLVAARVGRVVLEVPPCLQRLLSRMPGPAQCIEALCVGNPMPPFDRHCPLMSLPLAFGTTLDTVPNAPYLNGLVETKHARREGGPLRVGLVWSGNPKYPRDRLRSMRLDYFRPLFDIEGVEFVSLQKGAAAEQRLAGGWPARLPDAVADVRDFADTAEIVAALDLVITVDTGVAHLAGGMGKPVWVLLSNVPDWRWGLGRATTPWYPTARLFRQPAPDSWGEVMDEVRRELRKKVSAAATTPFGRTTAGADRFREDDISVPIRRG